MSQHSHVTPQRVASDILEYHRTGRSSFYSNSDPLSLLGSKQSSLAGIRSREDYIRAVHAAYLVDVLLAMGPSFGKTLKKIEQTLKDREQRDLIAPVARSALYCASVIQAGDPSAHLNALWDLVRGDPSKIRLVEGEAYQQINALRSWGFGPEELVNNVAYTAENLPGVAASLLLFVNNEDKRLMSGIRPTKTAVAMASGLFAPLYQEGLVAERKALLEALRLLCKRSPHVARCITQLHALYVFHGMSTQRKVLHNDAETLLLPLHAEEGPLDHAVLLAVHSALNQLEEVNDLTTYESRLDATVAGVKGLVGKANRNDLDKAIVRTLLIFCQNNHRGGIAFDRLASDNPALKMELLTTFYNRFATVAQDWQACVWSVLCNRANVDDYKKSGRNKNSILRAALNVIELEPGRPGLRRHLAEAAISANYDNKAIGLMLHGKANREDIMKRIYHLVGDRKILEIMPGQTRKSTLMDELGL